MSDSRRDLLKKLAAGAALAALPAGAATTTWAAASRRPEAEPEVAPEAPSAAAPWWLLAPLGPGSGVGNGWALAGLSDVTRGAAVLTLAHTSGATARVHLCAHDGRPRGLASTAFLDFILMDGGDGSTPTDEGLGRVLLGLAAHVRATEVRPDADLRQLAPMMTHGDRVFRFGPETLT